MTLSFEQIKSITTGAVRVTQEEDGIHFFRFTEEQMTFKQAHVGLYHRKILATSGIKLSFRTNSRTLYVRADMTTGSGRTYFSLDVVVNGTLVDTLDNFSHLDLPANYAEQTYEKGWYEKTFALGEGEKDVCVHLPWSPCTLLQELSLDDGATLHPLVPAKKLLAFGDSITQGYDAQRPSRRYIAQLSQALEAEEFNKAIGGSTTFPELARSRDSFDPDYVLVAYGTNDWTFTTLEQFQTRYHALLSAIRDNYPTARVFALTPIWRKEQNEMREMGAFSNAGDNISQIAAHFPNVTVIPGFDLVPKDERYFADLRLHPNDAGFDCYFNNLWPRIKALL